MRKAVVLLAVATLFVVLIANAGTAVASQTAAETEDTIYVGEAKITFPLSQQGVGAAGVHTVTVRVPVVYVPVLQRYFLEIGVNGTIGFSIGDAVFGLVLPYPDIHQLAAAGYETVPTYAMFDASMLRWYRAPSVAKGIAGAGRFPFPVDVIIYPYRIPR